MTARALNAPLRGLDLDAVAAAPVDARHRRRRAAPAGRRRAWPAARRSPAGRTRRRRARPTRAKSTAETSARSLPQPNGPSTNSTVGRQSPRSFGSACAQEMSALPRAASAIARLARTSAARKSSISPSRALRRPIRTAGRAAPDRCRARSGRELRHRIDVGVWIQCAPRSNGTPKILVSVTQRPPTSPAASSTTNAPAGEAATRRAAAMPAAPAPTMTTSTGRTVALPAAPDGCRLAAAARRSRPRAKAAEAARNERRVRRFMVSDCWRSGRRHHAGMRLLPQFVWRRTRRWTSRRTTIDVPAGPIARACAVRPSCVTSADVARRTTMLDAAVKALAQMFSPPFRAVLLKSVGLALLLIVLIGDRPASRAGLARGRGESWAESTLGVTAHMPLTMLAWVLSIAAGARHRRRLDLPDAGGDRAGGELLRRRDRARSGAPPLSRRAGRHAAAALPRAYRGRQDRAAGGPGLSGGACRSCCSPASAS